MTILLPHHGDKASWKSPSNPLTAPCDRQAHWRSERGWKARGGCGHDHSTPTLDCSSWKGQCQLGLSSQRPCPHALPCALGIQAPALLG